MAKKGIRPVVRIGAGIGPEFTCAGCGQATHDAAGWCGAHKSGTCRVCYRGYCLRCAQERS